MSAVPGHFRLALDDLAKRRRHDRIAIIQLAACVGLDPASWLDETEPAQCETTPPAREPKRPTRETREAKRDTSRPIEAPTEMHQRILSTLKRLGRTSPGALADALKINKALMRYHLKGLIASGAVEATGKTTNRLLSVP